MPAKRLSRGVWGGSAAELVHDSKVAVADDLVEEARTIVLLFSVDVEDVGGCNTDRRPYDRLARRGGDLGYAMNDCQAIEFLLSPLGGAAVVGGAVLAC